MSQDDLLRAYDRQLRGQSPARLPAGVRVERDGPLLRMIGFGGRGMVEYRDLGEAGKTVVCAGWVRFPEGTEFATLWGGGTLPAWRGRGIYRALVAYRARLAAERGRRYLEVDASDASRPILERLGFVAVTTTTPFIWSPEVSDGTAGVTRDP